MAVIQGNLADGKPMEYGGYYNGRAWNGKELLAPGLDFNGKPVSNEVIAQTNPNNVAYIQQQQQQAGIQPQGIPVPGASGGGTGGTGMTAPTQPAAIDFTSIYNSALNTPEALAANKAAADAQAEIDKEMAVYNESTARENNNPYYSASTLSGKIAAIDQAHNNTATALQTKLGNAQTKQAQFKADAQIKVNLAQGTYNMQNQQYQDNLNKFNTVMSAGGLMNASPEDLANYAAATGIPMSSLLSIQNKQKSDNITPQLVNSTDSEGNLTIAAIDKNTGKLINKTVIPGAGKGSGGTNDINEQSKQFDLDKKLAPGAAVEAAKAGKTLDDMMAKYGQWLDPQAIYNAYKSVNFYKANRNQQYDDQVKYGVQ